MNLDNLNDNFPFLTILEITGETYVGIVQNSDDKFITFYDYGVLKTEEDKKLLIELGQEWWDESNRLLPISVFLSGRLVHFRYALKTVSLKETTVVAGPVTSLQNLLKKRSKRRQIQLVKNM